MSNQEKLTFKILIIGSNCKTSLIEQYVDYKGENQFLLEVNNQIATLKLIEMSGSERFQTSNFYSQNDCCIIVYGSNDRKPIQTLDYQKNLYLKLNKTENPLKPPIFVIQYNSVEKNEMIKSYLVEQWCKQNSIYKFFCISTSDNLRINDTFLEISKILSKQKQQGVNMEKQVSYQNDYFQKSENSIMKSQQKCNMQEKSDQIQCYNQHNSPPIIVLLDDNLKGVQRLICSQCINDIRGRFNGINIEEAIQTIEDRKYNFLNIISDSSQRILSILNNFISEIMQSKTLILQTMDQMVSQINIWIEEIQQLGQKQCYYSFFDEIDLLNQSIENIRNKNIDEYIEVIETINQSYETKIQITEQLLQKHLLRAQNTLKLNQSYLQFKQLNQEGAIDNVDTKSYNQLQCKLVQEVKQNEWCHALAFNYDESIMVASLNKSIKIWNFEQGQLLDKNLILDGHEKLIKCIVFSKKYNWFFSGSEDNTIRSWLEKQSWFSFQKWESVKANKTHSNWVIQLILNEQENELISCSVDKTIKIWRISYDSNSIKFLESLEKHNQQILSISLSQSQQQLISWGEDKQVILWEKNQQLKWQFKNIILLSIQEINRGARFLMDNQIICKTSQGQVECYKLEKDEYKKQQTLDFDVQNPDQNPLEFQIIFNIQTKLIIMKHHKQFYFFRESLDDGKLKQVSQPLECQKEVCFFNITNDGKYFVVWIWYPILKFKVYELIYSNMQ